MMVRKVLIIGSGFAGTALALFLKRAGFDPEIYEARSALEVDAGAFLYLAPNGVKVLKELGLDRPLEQDGFPATGMVFYNQKGRRIGELDNRSDLERYGARGQVLKRAQIFRVLQGEVARQGIPVHYGRRLEGLEVLGQEGVVARFAGGTSAEGEVLVGADGINSSTRRIILPQSPGPRYTGLVDTGGFTFLPSLRAHSGPQHMIFGHKAFFSYVVRPSGEVYWFSNVPWAREPTREELKAIAPAVWKQRLLELHAGDPAPVVEIIRSTEAEGLGKWPLRDMPSLPAWHKGPVCLVGDAAHATSPSAGQGASLALEDAAVLAKCLRDIRGLEPALAAFQRLRKGRVEQVVRQSRRNGDLKIPHPVMGRVRDLLMPVFLRAAERAAQPIYGYTVDWEAPTPAPAVDGAELRV